MMDRKLANLAVLGAMAAGGASATTMQTITQRIDLGSLLSAGGNSTASGVFDINAFLTGNGAVPFTVTSASVTAYAFSDAALQTSQTQTGYYTTGQNSYVAGYQPYYAQSAYYYSYVCGHYFWTGAAYYCGATGYYYYVAGYYPVYATNTNVQRDITNHQDDLVVDTLRLLTGDQTLDGAVGTTTNTMSDFGGSNYESTSGGGYYGSTTYYNRQRSGSEVHSGAINIAAALDQTGLSDLSADGIMGFSFQQLIGQANVGWIELTADVEVPEPGTIGIMGTGILALGLSRRARDRRKKSS